MLEKMRRKDRAMDLAATKELLQSAEYGTLATVGKDNMPYLVPMSFVYIEDSLYFHCAVEGRKINNMKENAKACFNVVEQVELLPSAFSTKYKSAVVSGKFLKWKKKMKRQERWNYLCKNTARTFMNRE
jgi:nitroimidazol reductase NimA-like FMN-containing flavoprotein (pyridoxamine 5'-phosphate oxidase superfamily)